MRLKLFALPVVLLLLACGGSPTGPTPTGTGNPVITFPPSVFQTEAASLIRATPISGSTLRMGQTVKALVEFTLSPDAYPGEVFVSLDAGRIGFTCGYMELKGSSPTLSESFAHISCHLPIDESFRSYYNEYGRGASLTLHLSVYGWRLPGNRYQRSWQLPLQYSVQL